MAENNSSKAAIVENHEVLEKVLNDDYSMARTVDITDCSLNIQTVDFSASVSFTQRHKKHLH
ncbi:hypothetical protein ACFSJQ_22765 [Vibrio olivae]